MKFSMLRKTLPISIFLLLMGVTRALTCDCMILSTTESFEKATAVFTGKVTGFEYRKDIPNPMIEKIAKRGKFEYETKVVRMEIGRLWKGEAPAEIFIVTNSTRNSDGTSTSSSCDYNFKEGETYLIFATGAPNELRTSFCMHTRPLADAAEDLKILGAGYEPVKEGLGVRE